MTMLFADIRGSTSLAEKMSPSRFSQLLNRFYSTANDVLVKSDGFIDKLVGDEIIGLYIPAFAGKEHARKAVLAAAELLSATGHGKSDGPWIPVGIGVNTGTVYFGTVGSQGKFTDLTALGDAMNITARLASKARQGEILISENTFKVAGLSLGNPEKRRLTLKGKRAQVSAYTVQIRPH